MPPARRDRRSPRRGSGSIRKGLANRPPGSGEPCRPPDPAWRFHGPHERPAGRRGRARSPSAFAARQSAAKARRRPRAARGKTLTLVGGRRRAGDCPPYHREICGLARHGLAVDRLRRFVAGADGLGAGEQRSNKRDDPVTSARGITSEVVFAAASVLCWEWPEATTSRRPGLRRRLNSPRNLPILRPRVARWRPCGRWCVSGRSRDAGSFWQRANPVARADRWANDWECGGTVLNFPATRLRLCARWERM